jgi:alpha-amylase
MKKYLSMAGVIVILVAVGLAMFLLFKANPSTPTLPLISSPSPSPMPSPSPSPTAPLVEVPVSPLNGMPQGTDGYKWWNDTTFYEIFVRSFYDSDDNGVGDFNGITAKLDYLNDGNPETSTDLGVTGIWLMPINPSPTYHGYDITDYYTVNTDYGTMDDFKNMVNEAHKRGIRVILDLVLNHTSSQNPWFVGSWDSLSAYHDWYIWSETNPGYYGPWGQQVWYPSHSQYYYALFWDQMPDLNYTNPAVTAEMENIVKFWLDAGVDGFRLDAARHLIENGAQQVNTDATHAWYQQFRIFYKAIDPNAVTVGELAGEDAGVMATYTQGDQLDLALDFNLASAFVSAAGSGNAGTALGQVKISYKLIPPLQFASFLTNHDQNRLMTQLKNDPDKVKVAASLLLTSPGVPFIYYGEEVGLEGQKPDEDIRRPMQWSTEKNSGFSTSTPWELVGPDWQTNNVASDTADPTSILSFYRTLIQIRNEHAALRVGKMEVLYSGNPALYTILRVSQEEMVLVIVNLSAAPINNYKLSLAKSDISAGTYNAVSILGAVGELTPLTINAQGGLQDFTPLSEIPAYGTVIIQLLH